MQNMLRFIDILGLFLFAFLCTTVRSDPHVYTYDDGVGNDEHCCLMRVNENFCLAKPLTRSLIQVNKDCQRLNANEKNKNLLDKISRRLNIEKTENIDDKILVELKQPLDKIILRNDIVCLSSENNNNINLSKCYVQLAQKTKKNKVNHKNKNNTNNETNTDETPTVQQINLNDSIQINEGHGLSFRQTFTLNLTGFHPKTQEQRECWSWYRQNAKQFCNHPNKYKQSCISLSTKREDCLKLFIGKKSTDDSNQSTKNNFLTIGSKLFCETRSKQTQYIGYYYHSSLYFQTHEQILLEYKFKDLVSLADKNKNKKVLLYIANSTKLSAEFENDCQDKITLAEIRKSVETQIDEPPKNEENASA